MRISERGSLIVPVTVAVSPSLSLGRVAFVAKAEHHYTVLNYGIGKKVKKVLGLDPSFAARMDELLTTFDFSFALGTALHHVIQKDDARTLQTIVVSIEAPIDRFFAAARAFVDFAKGEHHQKLSEALLEPPPPHITLYTTDPEGKLGIGLTRVADLEAAREKAANGDVGAGLFAYRLAPDLVEMGEASLAVKESEESPAG
jgi:hypothetical protein